MYVFDEPFSNLDKELSHELIIEKKQIFTELRSTVIFISHDLHEAFTMADELFVMSKGKIIARGSPEKILHSKDERAIKLLEAQR